MATIDVKRSRRGSYEFEDIPSITASAAAKAAPSPSLSNTSTSPTRTRVLSNPSPAYPSGAMSAGPYRTSFNVGGVPIGGMGGNTSTSGSRIAGGHIRGGSSSGSGSNHGLRGGSISRPSFAAPHAGQGSPLGPYGAHARAPSLSTDTAASPFRSSFSPNDTNTMPSSSNGNGTALQQQQQQPTSNKPSQRHSRIHSRNLSIFFPRPGATAVPSIAEDGAQEIEAPVSSIPMGTPSSRSRPTPHPATFIPAPPPRSQLGGGFKFGGKPPPPSSSSSSTPGQQGSASSTGSMQIDRQATPNSATSSTDGSSGAGAPSSVPMSKVGTPTSATQTTTSRRGHHHRHSLSHSFFSFMDISASSPTSHQHRRQPSNNLAVNVMSPSPTSPTSFTINGHGNGHATPQTAGWAPISPFPASATSAAFPPAQLLPPKRTVSFSPALPQPSTQRSSPLLQKLLALPAHMQYGLGFAGVEGAVGCALWVLGQHYESLACAGLAYWVAFDAIGIALGVYGRLVDGGAGGGSLRLPYGAKRTETVALFAQAVYLLFSAVYICKETLEHALLSAGDAGHHHHHSPGQNSGLRYPYTFLWLSFIALSLSSTLLKSNIKILDASGIYIPSFRQLYRLFSLTPTAVPGATISLRPSSSLLLSNPYTLFPLFCTLLLLSLSTLPITQDSQRTADMLIAGIEAFGTFYLAWPACKTLGTVLLQTAPERLAANKSLGVMGIGRPEREMLTAAKGTMEALLRTMKEIERHPQVLHLPAPHVWQLSPPSTYSTEVATWEGKAKRDDDDDFRGSSRLGMNGSANGHGHARMSSHSPSFARLRANGAGIGGAGGARVKVGSGKVIVTVELHVSKELEDVECLELTRWAWQRCVSALGQGEEGVTVGIVRG